MKKIHLLLILMAFAHPAVSQTTSHQTYEDFKKLDWLVGTWSCTNTKPNQSAHEHWEKISPQEFRGFGVTLQGADTVFIEKLHIVIKDGNIVYVADVPENQKLIYFKLTEVTNVEVTNVGFVCENPEHDFPKKITYQLNGNKLKAQISGGGKMIDYLFEKR